MVCAGSVAPVLRPRLPKVKVPVGVAQGPEVVWLSRTALGRGFELGSEVVGRMVAAGEMASFGIVTGDVVTAFEPGFGQAGETAVE